MQKGNIVNMYEIIKNKQRICFYKPGSENV